jgi:amidase
MTTSMTRRRFNTGMAGLTATAALRRSIGPAAAETSELWSLPASEVARLVRTRKASAREVADSALQRLDSVNPRITAIVDCRPDLVREQADRVDRVLASGNDPGPLAGVPVTVKLNIDQVGFATSDGSRLHENRIAKSNSPAVDNVVRAGAVVLGRSNMPTFAVRWFTSNLTHITHVIRC